MFYFISELFFFVSLAVMIYILAQKLPVIEDNYSNGSGQWKVNSRKLVARFSWLGVLDKKFISFLEKLLRKSKLILMKLDNFVAHHLESVKSRNGSNENGQSVVKDLHSEVSEEKEESTKV